MKDAVGLLILGHGSTLPYNKSLVEEMAVMISKIHQGPVRTAYLNMNEPRIPDGLKSFEGTGVKRIVALPLFLADGVHTTEDIPKELGIPKGETKGSTRINGEEVEVVCARPLGADPAIANLAYQRAKEAMLK
jgi:sirohydrochlorin cobaltochelatase